MMHQANVEVLYMGSHGLIGPAVPVTESTWKTSVTRSHSGLVGNANLPTHCCSYADDCSPVGTQPIVRTSQLRALQVHLLVCRIVARCSFRNKVCKCSCKHRSFPNDTSICMPCDAFQISHLNMDKIVFIACSQLPRSTRPS
jgi:hypothetical protein